MKPTKNQILTMLDKVVALVEKGWTQNVSARTEANVIVSPQDERACKFCLFGAMLRVGGFNKTQVEPMLEILTEFIDDSVSVTFWNDDDNRTQNEVILAVIGARIAYKERLIRI